MNNGLEAIFSLDIHCAGISFSRQTFLNLLLIYKLTVHRMRSFCGHRCDSGPIIRPTKNQHITDKVLFVDPIPEYGVRTTAIRNILVCNKIQRNDVRAPQCILSLHGNMCKGMFSVDAHYPLETARWV